VPVNREFPINLAGDIKVVKTLIISI